MGSLIHDYEDSARGALASLSPLLGVFNSTKLFDLSRHLLLINFTPLGGLLQDLVLTRGEMHKLGLIMSRGGLFSCFVMLSSQEEIPWFICPRDGSMTLIFHEKRPYFIIPCGGRVSFYAPRGRSLFCSVRQILA